MTAGKTLATIATRHGPVRRRGFHPAPQEPADARHGVCFDLADQDAILVYATFRLVPMRRICKPLELGDAISQLVNCRCGSGYVPHLAGRFVLRPFGVDV